MTGFLVMVGIVFYGLMYSGLWQLRDPDTAPGTLDVLRGNISGEPKPAPTNAAPTSAAPARPRVGRP